jgi:hypothetical protein
MCDEDHNLLHNIIVKMCQTYVKTSTQKGEICIQFKLSPESELIKVCFEDRGSFANHQFIQQILHQHLCIQQPSQEVTDPVCLERPGVLYNPYTKTWDLFWLCLPDMMQCQIAAKTVKPETTLYTPVSELPGKFGNLEAAGYVGYHERGDPSVCIVDPNTRVISPMVYVHFRDIMRDRDRIFSIKAQPGDSLLSIANRVCTAINRISLQPNSFHWQLFQNELGVVNYEEQTVESCNPLLDYLIRQNHILFGSTIAWTVRGEQLSIDKRGNIYIAIGRNDKIIWTFAPTDPQRFLDMLNSLSISIKHEKILQICDRINRNLSLADGSILTQQMWYIGRILTQAFKHRFDPVF